LQLPPLTFVSPSELPDYRPAFTPGSTRVDTDGNLWIRTSHNVNARPVYDVVNGKGELIDRVQLPQNRTLAGFGQNGVVYLAVRDGATAHLERARIR
jgi:sugar lactone lactonase YvrE